VALGTDVALLSAASNDLTFEKAYARQVEALVTQRDLLILHSTSGRSPNLLAAAEAARVKGTPVIALLGRDGGPLRAMADIALVVDHDDTGRIQLVHMAVQHVIVGLVESRLTAPGT
jgi:D-sedoheptulose 7-phosphate isomerase